MKSNPQRAEIVRQFFQLNKKKAQICKDLKVNKMAVGRAIKLFEETGGTKDRPGRGRNKQINEAAIAAKIKDRIRRKRGPMSIRKLAKSLKISTGSIHKLMTAKMKLKFHRLRKEQLLTVDQKGRRVKKSKELLERFNSKKKLHSIVFTDEKLFCIEQVSHLVPSVKISLLNLT